MDGLVAMLPAPLRALSTHHDFHGQKVAERTYQVIIVIAGIIGFFVGYHSQQLSYALYTVIGASIFTSFIILPPWPFLFRKNPIVWVTPGSKDESKKTK